MKSILETIKKRDSCHVRMTFEGVDSDGDYVFRDERCLGKLYFDADSVKALVTPISYANGIKNTETVPKYDPFRKFRKGDIVRVVEWNGRDIARAGQIGHVMSNEINSRVELSIDGWARDVYYPACHLEIVTTAEELEPYKCGEGIDAQLIFFQDERFAEFENEEDAQRVCAWLNSEYRKEKSND